MKKINNIFLVFAVLFFLASTAFTVRDTTMLDPSDCNICDAQENCKKAAGGQVGKTDCTDSINDCDLTGYFCWIEPEPE